MLPSRQWSSTLLLRPNASLSANGHAPRSDRASLLAPGRYSRQPSSCAGCRGLLGRAHRPHEAPARGGRPLSCFNTNPKPKEARQASKQEGRQAVRPAQARPGKARFKMQRKAGQRRAGQGRQATTRSCLRSLNLQPLAPSRRPSARQNGMQHPQVGRQAAGQTQAGGQEGRSGSAWGGGNVRKECSARGAARLKHALARNFEGRFPKWGCLTHSRSQSLQC